MFAGHESELYSISLLKHSFGLVDLYLHECCVLARKDREIGIDEFKFLTLYCIGTVGNYFYTERSFIVL